MIVMSEQQHPFSDAEGQLRTEALSEQAAIVDLSDEELNQVAGGGGTASTTAYDKQTSRQMRNQTDWQPPA